MARLIGILSLLLLVVTMSAQEKLSTRQLTRKNGLYVEKYYAMASDTSVKHGQYQMMYKGRDIEKGEYRNGARVGRWKFYNLSNEIEFVYDYDTGTPHQIIKHKGAKYGDNTYPSMFLGSPIRPYHFITHYTYYPVKESENREDCQVVLVLEISSDGDMVGYHIDKSSKPEFNRVVLEAASKMPRDWKWVPARFEGKKVASEYCITIVFEAVEDEVNE